MKKCKYTKDALDIAFEGAKLVKFPQKLKDELAIDYPGICVLCLTHWTMRATSLKSLLSNYVVLQKL